MLSRRPPRNRVQICFLALIGLVANGLILLSPYWHYMHYDRVDYETPAADVSWMRFLLDLHTPISLGLLILAFLPVLIPLIVYILILFLSFSKTFSGRWIGKFEFIVSMILSSIGINFFVLMDVLFFVWAYLFSASSSNKLLFEQMAYGPAFWYPPIGFLISLVCAGLLWDKVLPSSGEQVKLASRAG